MAWCARRFAGEGPFASRRSPRRRDGFGVLVRADRAATAEPRRSPVALRRVSGHLVHVRIDPQTGQVRVLGYVLAQDVGHALNPALVGGQLTGGATQGIGWSLLEGLRFDEQGQMLSGSFMDYAVPSAPGVPDIETILVEVPAPDGPFGAKGVGEAPGLRQHRRDRERRRGCGGRQAATSCR